MLFGFLQKRRVEAIKAEEPAFIKRFRERSGMRPEPTIESKKAQARRSADDDDDLRDREDEAPQVVAGIGVSESEAIEFSQRNLVKRQPQAGELVSAGEDKPTTKEIEAEQSGRVLFRKPRVKEDSKVTGVKGAKNERKKETEKPKRAAVVQKDKKQGGSLSFSYEDDEDEDD